MARKRKRSQLVCQHLEHISGRLFEEYAPLIRYYTRHRQGVYALYRHSNLYYVGLAKNLRNRLKAHLRDRHAGKWNFFSMYLTVDHGHLKELESLILRIATPRGNRTGGKFARSYDLRRELARRLAEEQKREREELLGLSARRKKAGKKKSVRVVGREPTLAPYIRKGFPIRWRFKGKVYRARVRKSGRIRFRGKTYNSPSHAATTITHRAMNGWAVWEYQHAPGAWVPLDDLRKR